MSKLAESRYNIAMQKQNGEYITIFQEELTGGYSVWVPELPGCASQGETLEEAIANIKEAIELYLEDKTGIQDSPTQYKNQFTVPINIYA